MSFFFQAEDGIRGGRVTGVQTCALPISKPQAARVCDSLKRNQTSSAQRLIPHLSHDVPVLRSEERRVGKECRARRAAYDAKEKPAKWTVRQKTIDEPTTLRATLESKLPR